MIDIVGLMSLQDLLDVIAQSFFGGNTSIAGILLYMAVLGIMFQVFARNNLTVALLLALPITLIFSILGVLPTILSILLVVVAVIGLANEYRKSQME